MNDQDQYHQTADQCGVETTSGDPCQNPAGDNGHCWIPSHNPASDGGNPGGRPKLLDDETRQRQLFDAVENGLKIHHQAAAAGVSTRTLRRYACCIDTLRQPELDPNACEFCRNYARAHAKGASAVLEQCRPEFRASASFGYQKTEERRLEHTGEGGGPVMVIDDSDQDQNQGQNQAGGSGQGQGGQPASDTPPGGD